MLYNLVWFSLPIAALAICMLRPAAAAETVGAVQVWARVHARTLLMTVAFVIGAIMITAGILRL